MTKSKTDLQRIALVGGGPTSLYVLRKLVDSGKRDISVTIFERSNRLGAGMPYSRLGAEVEHVTNISFREMPLWKRELESWLEKSSGSGCTYGPQEVIPRLLFGNFLEQLFSHYRAQANRHFPVEVKLATQVVDVALEQSGKIRVVTPFEEHLFETVFLCSGHSWPKELEVEFSNFFQSPYPPSKLRKGMNHTVALRGSSLTAIDAIRTLALHHGKFVEENGKSRYRLDPRWPEFRLVMHCRSGSLPCPRFHFKEPLVSEKDMIDWDKWADLQEKNSGFIPLDALFHDGFKNILKREKSPVYHVVKNQSVEEFVSMALESRDEESPFQTFHREFESAKTSFQTERPIRWKEAVSLFSFVTNYAVKHLCAEDILRYEKHIKPLVATVIAFVPPSSAEQLLTLHDEGIVSLVKVDEKSSVKPHPDGGAVYTFGGQETRYQTYIDCVGQPHFDLQDFPFRSLREQHAIAPASVKFRSLPESEKHAKDDPERVFLDATGQAFLKLQGIAINDVYQPLKPNGNPTPNLYVLAVPLIGGHNPDFSGLDVADVASTLSVNAALNVTSEETLPQSTPTLV